MDIYILYITSDFKTNIRVPILYIQTLIRSHSESLVNRTRINSAQSIFFMEYPQTSQECSGDSLCPREVSGHA